MMIADCNPMQNISLKDGGNLTRTKTNPEFKTSGSGVGDMPIPWTGYRSRFKCIAKCNSRVCIGKRAAEKAVIKEVPIETVFCPDCGMALFWETKRT
jgi:hypothetical protein